MFEERVSEVKVTERWVAVVEGRAIESKVRGLSERGLREKES